MVEAFVPGMHGAHEPLLVGTLVRHGELRVASDRSGVSLNDFVEIDTGYRMHGRRRRCVEEVK